MRVRANVHKCECESEKEKARVSDIVGESIWMKLSESLTPGFVYFELSALCDQRRFASFIVDYYINASCVRRFLDQNIR